MAQPNVGTFSLAWRIARREMRTGLTGFRVFLICLTLGVASIAAVGSLSQAVTSGLMADARVLLGGDVDISQQHVKFTDEERKYFEAHSSARSSTIEMKAMAQTGQGVNGTRALVELKGVDAHYPLVDSVTLNPTAGLQTQLSIQDGVWGAVIDRGLLIKLDVALGDNIRVGKTTFQLRGVIEREPDRVASIVNFGPRFMVAAAALEETGLIQPGSQIRYRQRVMVGPDQTPQDFIKNLKANFPDAAWRIHGPGNAAPGLQRFIDRLTLFLTFAGLTALLVGGIGVLSAVKSYLDTKTTTIATLKCVGAPSALVFQAYLMQVLMITLLSIALGLVLGALLPIAGIELVKSQLPVAPQIGIYPDALFKAAVFGLLVSLTFALWPLAQAQETPAANLFRTNVAPITTHPKKRYGFAVMTGVIVLALLVVYWAEERNFAYWFVAVSLATVFLLHLGSLAVMKIAAHAPRPQNAVTRLVLANLHRPGTATPSVVQALGVGLSVLVGVALIQGNIAQQVEESIPEHAPAYFFIDIQPHQVETFDKTIKAVPGTHDLLRKPSMRGRVVKINGVPVDQVDVAQNVRWAIRGDRALSYAAIPPKGTEFVAGQWWDQNYNGPPQISFDAQVASGFGVGIGDTLTINVLGRDITAEITSLRKIDWRTLRFDFAIIFAPGTLEGAPHTHIAAVMAPEDSEPEIERVVADTFGNVSAIRVRDALAAANRLIAGIGTAVTGTASVTVLAGIIVLGGAIAAARTRRIYDSVVFKVLGATRKQVMGAFLFEYGLLGLFTGLVGASVGTLISWAVIEQIMGMNWSFMAAEAIITVIGAILLTLAMGFFGTWRAMGEKASGHLRNE
ncbi:MAG: ABC transporter permease [Magnetovibrio sp.]|nr:ABC transporter permease [Magnetovibrio sp.]